MVALKDRSGERYGKLLVMERAGTKVLPSGKSKPLWKCRCDCGSETITIGDNLQSGNTIGDYIVNTYSNRR